MARAPESLVHQFISLLGSARPTSETDGQLLTRWVSAKDNRAFAALVGRHGALVWRVSQNILHRREDVEDAFQATFLVLARKAAGLQNHASVAGWLFQTAQRLALKARTAAVRRCRHQDKAQQKTTVDPLEEISVREALAILSEELNRLSAAYREPILLCLYEGATQDEAARRLSCSLRTLTRRLERARTLLSQRLSRRGLAPTSALALTLCSLSNAPAQLMHKTITAAAHFACGQAATGTAALLANGALQTLMLKKVGVYIALVLAMGSLSVAAGFALVQGKPLAEQAAKGEAKPVEDEKPKPRIDALGDPLPPGAIQRIGSSRLRHGEMVLRTLFTPDGKTIASTSSYDGYVKLWDSTTGKLRWRFAVSKEGMYQNTMVISTDGTKLSVLSDIEYVVLGSDTGKIIIRHEWPKGKNGDGVRCSAIAADLGSFALGCFDGTVRLYDGVTGKEKVSIAVGEKGQNQFPTAIELSANGKIIYVVTDQKLGIMVFDAKTGKAVSTLETRKTLNSPPRLVLSRQYQLLAAMDGAQVVLMNLKTGNQRYLLVSEGSIFCGVFSSDASSFAVGLSQEIVLFDTSSGKERQRLRAPGTRSLSFTPDGKRLAAGNYGGTITIWDVATGKPLPPSPEPKGLSKIQFTNNDKNLLIFADGVELWDAMGGTFLRRLPQHPKSQILFQSASQDGKLLACLLNKEGDVALVNAHTGETLHTLSGHRSNIVTTTFSPDGTRLFSAGWFDPRVFIWEVATGKLLHQLQSHTKWVDLLTVSPNGRWLASAAKGNNARDDWDIRLWEVATGKLVHRLATPRNTYSMVFSPDSSFLVSVGADRNKQPFSSSGEVRLWDVSTGKLMRTFAGDQTAGCSIATTRDGRMLASGHEDSTLRLWEVASGMERGRINGHASSVFSLDFSQDGKLLAAASSDAPIYLWDVYSSLKRISPNQKLAKEDREKLWQSLADLDATIAFQAICELIARPSEAVTLLQAEWTRLPRATPQQMHKWVEDLNSDQFAVRKTATVAIERFAAGHEDLLRDALKQASSLEVRQRLERILGRLDPQPLRNGRMLEVLEQIRTDPARQFLRTLAEQKEDSSMAREAAADLQRLEKQK